MPTFSTNSLDYMQRLLQSTLPENGRDAGADGTGFSSIMAELTVTVTETSEVAGAPETVDDVKRDFYDYLDSLGINAGLSKTNINVHVTDAAFEKMLADPEYRQKMKDLCARDLCDPAWGRMAAGGIGAPSAITVTIDADCEEEYLASSYGSAVAPRNSDSGSFWSRRSSKNKVAQKKVEEKRALEKRELLDLLMEKTAQRRIASDSILARFVPQDYSGTASAFSENVFAK